jgi:nucleoside-diphosphate kinase
VIKITEDAFFPIDNYTTIKVDNRYCFMTDWYDPQACFVRKYQLLFYPIDNSIEMVCLLSKKTHKKIFFSQTTLYSLQYDVKTKKSFLKRSKNDDLQLKDLFVGNMITILSRSMKITEYGDLFTQRALSKDQEKYFV